MINEAGDDASGSDTHCKPVKCEQGQYVDTNTCKKCPAGTTNAAGDDASGSDTKCDPIICDRINLCFATFAEMHANQVRKGISTLRPIHAIRALQERPMQWPIMRRVQTRNAMQAMNA